MSVYVSCESFKQGTTSSVETHLDLETEAMLLK